MQMLRCWLCVALAAGCGRFGFGSHDGSGDAAPDDGASSDVLLTSDGGICHTGAWGTPQLLGETATGSEERGVSISSDELTLYFESNRAGGQMRSPWVTTRATRADAFGTPTLIAELDSAADDGDLSISGDDLTLYFSSKRSGTDDIYFATRPNVGATWVDQGVIPITGDPSTARVGPHASPDGLTLYYVGNLDIQVATRATTADTWTWVRELTELNAPQSEAFPSVSADGLEIFFQSYRSGPGMIYTASRASTSDVWSAPVQLPELIGSGTGAGSPSLTADGRTLYYDIASAQVDIYTATRGCL